MVDSFGSTTAPRPWRIGGFDQMMQMQINEQMDADHHRPDRLRSDVVTVQRALGRASATTRFNINSDLRPPERTEPEQRRSQ